MSDEMKKDFQVEIERVQTHRFTVTDVNSQEEAELLAEEWLVDGEQGDILDYNIVNIDSYPVDFEGDIN